MSLVARALAAGRKACLRYCPYRLEFSGVQTFGLLDFVRGSISRSRAGFLSSDLDKLSTGHNTALGFRSLWVASQVAEWMELV